MDIYREIVTLSSGTAATLIRETGLVEANRYICAVEAELFLLNFADWAKEEDAYSPFLTWQAAWKAFAKAGYPGAKFVLTGVPQ